MPYDTQCLYLAEYFLEIDAPSRLKVKLAQHIQNAVEDWLQEEAELSLDEINKSPD